MRKICLLLSVFTLISCEQEDLNNLMGNSKVEIEQHSTIISNKVAGTIADFDPIAELEDIPVNIINVGNRENEYLSCVKDGNKVDLYNKDDNSLRQRWYINNGGIYLVGGHDLSNSKTISIFTGGLTQESSPILTFTTPSKPWEGLPLSYQWLRVGSSYYNIVAYPFGGSNVTKYMQSESNTGSSLLFKTANTGALAQWEVRPVGDFECLKAAVQNGADSVYLGSDLFSARAFANNFSGKNLEGIYKKSRRFSSKTFYFFVDLYAYSLDY